MKFWQLLQKAQTGGVHCYSCSMRSFLMWGEEKMEGERKVIIFFWNAPLLLSRRRKPRNQVFSWVYEMDSGCGASHFSFLFFNSKFLEQDGFNNFFCKVSLWNHPNIFKGPLRYCASVIIKAVSRAHLFGITDVEFCTQSENLQLDNIVLKTWKIHECGRQWGERERGSWGGWEGWEKRGWGASWWGWGGDVQLEEKEDAETERFSIAQYHDFITYLRCEALGHLPQNIWRNLWNSVRVFPDQPQNTSTSHGYMNFVKKLRHVGDDITVILLMHL